MSIAILSIRESLKISFEQCRRETLKLFENIDAETFCTQAHPDFSPVGWHLGHIAFTEAYWILERCSGLAPTFQEYHQLFAADGLPKVQRQNLPTFLVIQDYLDTIRQEVFSYLEIAPIEKQERLWRWLLQHESQHSETIAIVLQLQRTPQNFSSSVFPIDSLTPEMVEIQAGEFKMGSDRLDALDNERPLHPFVLDTYSIDCYPVTCGQYRQFMEAGGYENQQWWSKAGWQWQQRTGVKQPLYWFNSQGVENHPVCGVSYYEAQAYGNFVGKRLPTEAEWEKAATWDAQKDRKRVYPWGNSEPNRQRCNYQRLTGITTPVTAYPQGQSPYGCYDMLGNVWEWTDSWFAGYNGFEYYPYPGYSQAYFDHQHRVLRGGSWATCEWGLRGSFRNWYHPWVRQIFAGFRCAS